jgi:hypothetical protein
MSDTESSQRWPRDKNKGKLIRDAYLNMRLMRRNFAVEASIHSNPRKTPYNITVQNMRWN